MPELRKSTDLQRVSITGHSLTSIVMLSRTPFFVNVNTAVWAVIRTQANNQKEKKKRNSSMDCTIRCRVTVTWRKRNRERKIRFSKERGYYPWLSKGTLHKREKILIVHKRNDSIINGDGNMDRRNIHLVILILQIFDNDTEQMIVNDIVEQMRRFLADRRHMRYMLHQVQPNLRV